MLDIIIPVYNEQENIAILCDMISSFNISHQICIIDDSIDNTTSIITKLTQKYPILHIKRDKKQGIGSAYKLAFEKTYNPYLIIMDGDLSHDPSYILNFIQHDSDIVISTRYNNFMKYDEQKSINKNDTKNYKNSKNEKNIEDINNNGVLVNDNNFVLNNIHRKNTQLSGTCGWPFSRKLTSRIANNIAQTFLNLNYSDLTGSYRLYKRESLRKIINMIESNGFNFQIEVLFYANLYNFKVTEEPIIFYERLYNSSKLGIWEYFGFMKVILKLIVKRVLYYFK
ncbi:Dolichol-phosphate mannosyltransferase subunit 1 [Dictyocoela muelleri]|nr:Dolichol-phosphate mannosyltransferase subunit 1 [Dictyocoela muelleri]